VYQSSTRFLIRLFRVLLIVSGTNAGWTCEVCLRVWWELWGKTNFIYTGLGVSKEPHLSSSSFTTEETGACTRLNCSHAKTLCSNYSLILYVYVGWPIQSVEQSTWT
jgi:hypothetical protein